MTEKEGTFRFKQFRVRQSRCAMKVGTDGVLLGALAIVASQESRVASQEPNRPIVKCLDLGTGTGLIALMIAQRNPEVLITAIDIDADAAGQAAENFALSPWADRLTAVCGDVRESGDDGKFDLIVCNPPFYEHSPAASSATRDTARRTDTLTHEQLVECASRLLVNDGRLEVIIPYATADEFVHLGWLRGLHLVRRIDIRTKAAKPYKRSVLSLVKIEELKNGRIEHTHSFLTLLNPDSTPTDEYRELTRDFYLDK